MLHFFDETTSVLNLTLVSAGQISSMSAIVDDVLDWFFKLCCYAPADSEI